MIFTTHTKLSNIRTILSIYTHTILHYYHIVYTHNLHYQLYIFTTHLWYSKSRKWHHPRPKEPCRTRENRKEGQHSTRDTIKWYILNWHNMITDWVWYRGKQNTHMASCLIKKSFNINEQLIWNLHTSWFVYVSVLGLVQYTLIQTHTYIVYVLVGVRYSISVHTPVQYLYSVGLKPR